MDDWLRVLPGEPGKIVIKANGPGLIMDGYFRAPKVNVRVFRDGRYYSGDLGQMESNGHFYFEGRKKNAIRRRGENLSAFEIEQVVDRHAAVLESAAYGVPSELGEEDLAVAVVLKLDETLTVASLVEFCSGKMARYMVPCVHEFS